MRNIIIFNLLVYGLIAIGVKSYSAKGSKTIAEQDVPRSIRTAFQTAYPCAVVSNFIKTKKDGQQIYEIAFSLADKQMEVRYSVSGQLLKVEELISTDSLPGNIRMAIADHFEDSSIKNARRVIKDNRLFYDVKLSGNAPGWEGDRALRFTDDARLLTKI